MEAYRSCVALVVIVLVIAPTVAFIGPLPNYQAVLAKIEQLHGKIDYKTFCKVFITTGGDKNVCRVKDQPSVGFLVCKKKKIDGENCEVVIQKELDTLKALQLANINTVDFYPEMVNHVTCGDSKSGTECSGLMEKWVGEEIGTFLHVRDYISPTGAGVQKLIDKVRQLTNTGIALSITATDLGKIKAFMVGPTKYRQICDLQGFFLKAGGFQVSDPTEIKETDPGDPCWYDPKDEDPTGIMVKDALKDMIAAFSN